MTTGELSQSVIAQGLHPIRVEGSADKNGYEETLFIGDLDGFWGACKAVGSKAVFIYASALEEEHFEYELDYDELVDDDEEEENSDSDNNDIVDLTIALPSLAEFKRRLGTDYAFILKAKGGFAEIAFYIEEPWWAEFDKQRDKAVDVVEANRDVIREKMEAKQEEREAQLVVKLKGLIDDSDFVSNPTQRGMRACALEKLPELEELSEETLKEEIQLLSDKIKARGLNRKRR